MVKTKVLHIVLASYPRISGYTIRTETILDSIDSQQFEIDVVGSIFSKDSNQLKNGNRFKRQDRTYFQLLTNSKLKILKLFQKIPIIRIISAYFSILYNTYLIVKNVSCKDYAIIHGHSSHSNGLSALLVAIIFKKPFVYDIHALDIDSYKTNSLRYKFKYYIEKWFEEIVINRSDAVITIDSHLKDHIVKNFKIAANKIYNAPNGIDSILYSKILDNNLLKDEHRIPTDKYLIGIDCSKRSEGYNFILDNRVSILSKISNIHFVAFGSNKMNVEDESFTFLPKIEKEEMPKYYSMLDLFVLPRLKLKMNEIITPLKILELMSCEIPVLVSDVGGLLHCVNDNDTGYVFKNDDFNDFIEKLKYIIKDPRINQIKNNAREWVIRNKSWKETALQYQDCYRNICNANNE
jgi:glycosyltransferase involved in cell wall biosynthesis